jgi:hypothetical protein
MPRTFRLVVPLGLFVLAGLAFPSVADAQRRGGSGGARGGSGATAVRAGGAVVRGGGAVVRGGGVYGGSHVAVPRTHPPYSYNRSYYSHPYYYRPYYSGYYPHYYSPWSFSLSFGFGWYGGFYAPSYAYPYPAYSYPAYSYPYSSPPPYPSASPNPSQPPYPSPGSDNGYNDTMSMPSRSTYQAEVRTTTARADDRQEFGTLSIRVMPADATILIDQQAWDRPHGDDRFSLELIEGSHSVEIRKAGYTTYVRTIDVPRGRSAVVNVALAPRGTGTIQVARTVPLRH